MSNAVCVTPRQSDVALCENISRTGPAEAALYIDSQSLTRDCVGQQLAMLLPETVVMSIAKAEDIPKDAEANSRFSVGILHKHATRAGPELADQLSRLAELTPNLPVVLLSDIDDADDIAKAFELGVRGYIP